MGNNLTLYENNEQQNINKKGYFQEDIKNLINDLKYNNNNLIKKNQILNNKLIFIENEYKNLIKKQNTTLEEKQILINKLSLVGKKRDLLSIEINELNRKLVAQVIYISLMSFIVGKSDKSSKENIILDETIFNNVDIKTVENNNICEHIFNYKIIYLNKNKIKLITTRIDADSGWDFNLEINLILKYKNINLLLRE